MPKPPRRIGNLPAETTSFVGRRRELAEIRKKLGAARMVSLVGPGGVGKTRLALRAATDLGRAFPDGAWLVELAEVRDPALVGNAMIAALDLRDQAAAEPLATLLSHVRNRDLLLVIDNCEHVLATAAALVTEVITSAPGVRVIATSREPLGVQGEHVVPVPPLQLPSAQADEPPEQLRLNESVSLFVERAAAASGSFELTVANKSAVADLCRRLDGLPLAIELAAVRTRLLSVAQILDRLTDRFSLLTGGARAALPRHQTLETAIDWSFDLLSPAERALLRRLCVFAGRFMLRDVEAVCVGGDAGSAQALDVMSSLVDKSLVIKEDARGAACYRLHETMREYAARKLAEAGELEAVHERRTDYYVTTCAGMALDVRFHLLDWLAWMDVEIDNIRAVLSECLSRRDSVRGISLATSVGWYWATRATTEGVRWLDEQLASGPGDPSSLPWSHFIRGFLAVLQGDWNSARPVLERASAAAAQTGDPAQMAHILSMAAIADMMAGDRESAARYVERAEAVAKDARDVTSTIAVLQARALNAAFAGDIDEIRIAASEGARLSREAGDVYALHMMTLNLGSADFFSGELDAATLRYTESLRLAYQIDDRIGQYYLLAALGCIAAIEGRAKPAAHLLGASETIREGAGANVMGFLVPIVAQAEESASSALGAARFKAEFEAGRRMNRDAAVALALGEAKKPGAQGEAPDRAPDDGLLGRREADVAALVAEGLSNKQIASRLFISERTVDSHVRSILNKLGFNSRAQIASWVSSHEKP